MSLSFSVIAETPGQAEQEGNQGNGQKNNRNAQNNQQPGCRSEFNAKVIQRKKETKEAGVEIPHALNECDYLYVVSKLNSSSFGTGPEMKRSTDNKITCQRSGGFTVDYNDCTRVLGLYNAALLAEQGMITTQSIQVNQKNTSQAKEVAERTALGDGQNAALDATKNRMEMNEKLFKTQAYAYSGAAAALAAQLGRWEGVKALEKKCSKMDESFIKNATTEMAVPTGSLSAKLCGSIIQNVDHSLVYQNDGAKSQIAAAAVLFANKAATAVKMANDNKYVAGQLAKQPAFNDEQDMLFEKCVVSPNDPVCKKITSQAINPEEFAGNTIQFGAGTNGLEFGAGTETPAGVDLTDPEKSGDNVVGPIDSPFEGAAKTASGILNPAAAASLGAGGPADPGAGGGGAGGGGGSASLGNDLAGADANANKDPDIDTNKLNGKYKSGGGGGGFQAVGKGSSDSANPFASMFDAKGEDGGIEEDGSIGSNEGGPNELFRRIGGKYDQIESEGRVQATLE